MFLQFDIGTLIASTIWSNVGIAMLIYGKKNENWNVFGVGGALLLISMLLPWLWLTLAGIVLCVFVFKR